MNSTDALREFMESIYLYCFQGIETSKDDFIKSMDSDLNALLDKLMPTEEEIVEAALRQTTHKSLLPAHRGLMKDYFIIGAKWLRNRMTEKPNNSEQQMWRDIQNNDK